MVEWRWWRTELQEDCLCQEIIQLFSFKKQGGTFYYWDYVVGTVLLEVPIALFCACFLKNMLNLRSFTACLFSFNPWIIEQKNFLLLQNWVHIVPIFLKLFSQLFFFKVWLIDSIVVKTLLLFRFFMQLYRIKYLKCLRTRKYILEHKCEWSLSLVWLCLAIVAFYLNRLDRAVLAHPFWALATFPVCFSVPNCWTNRAPSMGTKWSSWI